ncbi:MAG: DUF3631 domain-containing protein [Verrucomicrobiia bacterium]
MSSFEESFRVALRSHGLDYDGPILADGRLHRIRASDDREPNSWYVLHGDTPASGAFGCWKRQISETWCCREPHQCSQAEWDRIRQRQQDADRERQRAEAERQAEARATAQARLDGAKLANDSHPYIKRKGVRVHGDLRQAADGKLLIPLRDINGVLHSLQEIDEVGNKRFLSGGKVAGTFFTVAESSGPLVVCEGYATGASIYETTGYSVVAAMTCGNIVAVAQAMRAKHLDREIIMAADNDAWTAGNPGVTKATEAAKTIHAKLAVPTFADLTTHLTDFNDLHQHQGLRAVKAQIDAATMPTETTEETITRLAALSPIDFDRCREAEAKRLKIRAATLDEEVKERRPKKDANAQGVVRLKEVTPWERPVNGCELLSEIEALYQRYVHLPSRTPEVLAVWALSTWCYELFEFAGIVAVWSPEPECGKGRVLDVTEKIVRRPFRTSNTSAAVLYHVISRGNLTVLVDELDSVNNEQRAAICNILKGGFQANGTAHRMVERNGEQVEKEFPTFCPKMIATITMDKLDKATRTRTIGIRMQRKPRDMEKAKFRRVDCTDIQRRCLRWVQDNAEALRAVPPMDIAECSTDRQEDVWEPLIAIARVVGGDWEPRLRLAAKELTNAPDDGASQTISHQLLVAIRAYFAEGADRVDSKTLLEKLNSTGDFADANYGRGLNPQFIAKLLKPYGIQPRTIKLTDGKTAKGYLREMFDAVFATYLPDPPVSKGNSVTTPVNIDRDEVFEKVTNQNGYLYENAVSTNKDSYGDGVTFPEPESASEHQTALDL